MAANDYTRTVNITPLGTAYSWDTPPSWITINQVGTSNDWTITVAANSGAARSATLTVRHNNTTTTDTISVSQAGGTVITPTPTAVPVTPTPTPVEVLNTIGFQNGETSFSLDDTIGGPGTGTATIAWNMTGAFESLNPVPVVVSKDNRVSVSFTWGSLNSGIHVGSMYIQSLDPGAQFPVGFILNPLVIRHSDSAGVQATLSGTLVQGVNNLGDHHVITPTPTPISSGTGSGTGTGPTPTATSLPVPTPTQTTYVGGGGGGCHLAGDLLTLANGETKKVEDIVLGDTLLSLAINGLSDVETIYKEFNVSATDYSDEYDSAVVNDIYVDTYSSYYDINNGELQLTLEHPVLVKTSDDRVVFKVIKDILVGDNMLNQNNEWVLVNSNVLVQTETPFTTYAFNVENKDVYFASGILVHNVLDVIVDGKGDGNGDLFNQL